MRIPQMSLGADVEMDDGGFNEASSRGVVSMMSDFSSNPKHFTIDALFPPTQAVDTSPAAPSPDMTFLRGVHPERAQKIMSGPPDPEHLKPEQIKYVRPTMITPEAEGLDSVRKYLAAAKHDVMRLKKAWVEHTKTKRDWTGSERELNSSNMKTGVLKKQTKPAIAKHKRERHSANGGPDRGRHKQKLQHALDKLEHLEKVENKVNSQKDDQEDTTAMLEDQAQDCNGQALGGNGYHADATNSHSQNRDVALTTTDTQDQDIDFSKDHHETNSATTTDQASTAPRRPGKAALRTLVKHSNNNIFDGKTLTAVKDVRVLDSGNNNMQAIRVLRRNLENILHTFGEQSDQYQNFKFMVEESIAELETKMTISLKEVEARDAARKAKKEAKLARQEEKSIFGRLWRAYKTAKKHEMDSLKILLLRGNDEQKALAEARVAEMKAEEGVRENPHYRTRAVTKYDKLAKPSQRAIERAHAAAQEDGGVLLPLSIDEDMVDVDATPKVQVTQTTDAILENDEDNGFSDAQDEDDDDEIGGVALLQDDLQKLNELRVLLRDMQIRGPET